MKRRYGRARRRLRPDEVGEVAADMLEDFRLEAGLVPEAKLTLIIRLPDYDDADMLVTTDDLDELLALVQRRQTAGET